VLSIALFFGKINNAVKRCSTPNPEWLKEVKYVMYFGLAEEHLYAWHSFNIVSYL